MIRTLTFTETSTGATYTARTSIPRGARLLEVFLETTVAWTAATAPVDVGDSDAADALVKAANLKAQQGIDSSGKGGTDWGNGLNGTTGPYSTGGPGKLYPAGDVITAVLSPTVPGGPTGVSRITLWIELNATTNPATVV